MKKFEVLDHTADIAARVYGTDLEGLFCSACELLNFLLSPVFYSGETEAVKIDLYGDTSEELLVSFLNELIYRAEVKKRAGRVLTLAVGEKEGKFKMECVTRERKIKSRKGEIKAATYHGLRIVKKDGFFSAEIIFDV